MSDKIDEIKKVLVALDEFTIPDGKQANDETTKPIGVATTLHPDGLHITDYLNAMNCRCKCTHTDAKFHASNCPMKRQWNKENGENQ